MKSGLIDSIDRLGKGGLDVLNLVIPKPNIPPDIANNYKQVMQVGIEHSCRGKSLMWKININSSPGIY